MCYFRLLKSELFLEPEISESFHQIHEKQPKSPAIKSSPKYKKSGLTTWKAEEILRKLVRLMETDKPYQKNELTLNQLADIQNISPHHLSEVINTQLNLNFFDFVNQYRVEEVKENLANSDKANLTVLAIAYDAGFNSISSGSQIKRLQNIARKILLLKNRIQDKSNYSYQLTVHEYAALLHESHHCSSLLTVHKGTALQLIHSHVYSPSRPD